MSRYFILVFLVCAFTTNGVAQSMKSDSLFVPSQVKQFQFNLEKPAVHIELKYEQSGDPIKGNITRDGMRVLMDNYVKGQRVKAKVTYADGTTEDISKSPCFIDPVKFEL